MLPIATLPQHPVEPIRGSKKRRLPGSCDSCRRRKTKCDRANRPAGCSNCIAFNVPCIQSGPPRKGFARSSKSPASDADENAARLKSELTRAKGLLNRLCPDIDLLENPQLQLDELLLRGIDSSSLAARLVSTIIKDEETFFASSDYSTVRKSLVDVVNYARRLEEQVEGYCLQARILQANAIENDDQEDDNLAFEHHSSADATSLSDGDPATDALSAGISQMEVKDSTSRFFGKSSDVVLISNAMKLKNQVDVSESGRHGLSNKRPVFWDPEPLSPLPISDLPNFTFPDVDLMHSLIDVYFIHVNCTFPILHRPTFLKNIARGCHYHDKLFGAQVLMVCALAANADCNDPRAISNEVPLPLARGWNWFKQVHNISIPMIRKESLHEMQLNSLLGVYMHCNYSGDNVYQLVGNSIRAAISLGIHKRKGTSEGTVEGELWRRAFWVLILVDRIASALIGRPCQIYDEDMDLSLPIECDDEYWELPTHPFKQPAGKPSKLTVFVHFLKLSSILANACRTVYASKKSRLFSDVQDKDWQQRMVMELDADLNKWQEGLPSHLRWKCPREDLLFLDQSANLYAFYYYIRITIHRAFISTKPNSGVQLPLIICTTAARSCSEVVAAQQRHNFVILPIVQICAFLSGVVLSLNIWEGIRSGRSINIEEEMVSIQQCMDVLQFTESRWRIAGRLWDVLKELAPSNPLALHTAIQPATTEETTQIPSTLFTPENFEKFLSSTDISLPEPVQSPSQLFDLEAFSNFAASQTPADMLDCQHHLIFGGLQAMDTAIPEQHFASYYPQQSNDASDVFECQNFAYSWLQ